jgi:arylsulfatase A-like enzyme
MRAIHILFDSLKKNWLPPYGGDIIAPNFTRLAAHTAVFDNFYAGSLPCMPARRELHTGRYNFLHKGWSPLEPFDDSAPQLLGAAGVHTHLVSDHHHYWKDGGANYHCRYTTNEHIRGQEGDPWKGDMDRAPGGQAMAVEGLPENFRRFFDGMLAQDSVNRRYMAEEVCHSQTRVFDGGLEFLEKNKGADNWFLTIESFDPHEPFFTYPPYTGLYEDGWDGPPVDWPFPVPLGPDGELNRHIQNQYRALVSMLDKNLGRVLDLMDREDLWRDTLLIVSTDHGLLLGEHGWWSKGAMPPFNEIVNTPFFIWDPRLQTQGQRRKALAQTIDIPATLLDFFGLPLPEHMQGRPLGGAVEQDAAPRPYGLFGYHGGMACVTDGRYVYMRAPARESNGPLYEYTLMPCRMSARMDVRELQGVSLAEPFPFTKGCPVLKIDVGKHPSPFGNMYRYGNALYDLETDPGQMSPLVDAVQERRLTDALAALMRQTDAPGEQFERLGLG